jgi:hypothetical protein
VTAAGGGFHFDPDKVQTAINELNAILRKLETDIPIAQRLLDVRFPGPDPATKDGFHKAMRQSHQAHLQELFDFQDKVQNEVNNLTAAMNQYHETEASNRQTLRQRGV